MLAALSLFARLLLLLVVVVAAVVVASVVAWPSAPNPRPVGFIKPSLFYCKIQGVDAFGTQFPKMAKDGPKMAPI